MTPVLFLASPVLALLFYGATGALLSWLGPLPRLGPLSLGIVHQALAFVVAQPFLLFIARQVGDRGIDGLWTLEFLSRAWAVFHVYYWLMVVPSYPYWGVVPVLGYSVLAYRERTRTGGP